MMKHIAGPWYPYQYGGSGIWNIAVAESASAHQGRKVAMIDLGIIIKEDLGAAFLQTEAATARLVAASPRLYDLCQQAMAVLAPRATHDSDVDVLLDQIQAILARIDGK